MKYSQLIDQAAMSVARRLPKLAHAGLCNQDLTTVRRNPLFYPCLFAFMLVAAFAAAPLDSALSHASNNWLPSPIVTFGLLLGVIYPLARFCTTFFALRRK